MTSQTVQESSTDEFERTRNLMILEHNLKVKNRVSLVQVVLGLTAPAILIGIAFLAGRILVNPSAYSNYVLGMAASAVFVDAVAILGSVWAVFLRRAGLRSAFIDEEEPTPPA